MQEDIIMAWEEAGFWKSTEMIHGKWIVWYGLEPRTSGIVDEEQKDNFPKNSKKNHVC